MELVNLKGGTWAVPGPVNIGVYVKENGAVLIDSGNSPDAGRKILRLIEANGWNLRWIINTHFHADHVGGNAFIQKRTDCGIAASPKEAFFIDFPETEPQELWSGAAPKQLCNKFLQAEKSNVTRLFAPGDELEGFGLAAVDLAGHAHGQIGVRTPDNVLFIADSAISEKILEKYSIPFVADFERAMATFDNLEKMAAEIFVPSHGDICSDIKPMVKANRSCLEKLRNEIAEICTEPKTRDDILASLSIRHGINMNLAQYVLIYSTAAAIITPLIDSGELNMSFDAGTLYLKKRD
ncbi:MAG: MBL fold metallo-hydrolase [Synergistaceae bacterium]|nr:MBL fold metallo-hydrolase [Synergistaceae bacterium]